MQPIPRQLLIHTVTHYPKTGNDEYGRPTYGTSAELSNVRMERADRLRMANYGDESEDRYKMFYDYANSTAATLAQDDRIDFNGEQLRIRDIEYFYAFDGVTPHHLEVRLV